MKEAVHTFTCDICNKKEKCTFQACLFQNFIEQKCAVTI